jgi:mono/diheme cytochrome c family protein
MKFRLLIALFAALLTPTSILAASKKGNVKTGHELFAAHCQMCHGDRGQGNPVMGRALGAKIPNLGSKKVQSLTDAQIRGVIEHGHIKMPPVQGLPASEIDNVIAFVRTLPQKK